MTGGYIPRYIIGTRQLFICCIITIVLLSFYCAGVTLLMLKCLKVFLYYSSVCGAAPLSVLVYHKGSNTDVSSVAVYEITEGHGDDYN